MHWKCLIYSRESEALDFIFKTKKALETESLALKAPCFQLTIETNNTF